MNNSHLFVLFSFIISVNLVSAVVNAEGRWDRADRTMMELDAEVDKMNGKPPVSVETKVIEKVIIKEVLVPAPQPIAAPAVQVVSQSQSEPKPLTELVDQGVTLEADGYVFKLSKCALSHRNIKCQLNIISPDTDGKLTIYVGNNYASKLFDTVGNEYKPSKIIMGNKSNTYSITNTYISGVNVQGAIYFENVKNNTNEIALIELGFTNRINRKYSRIKFRPVNLSL